MCLKSRPASRPPGIQSGGAFAAREAQCGTRALASALTAPDPGTGGAGLPWGRALACRGPGGGCGHLPCFQKWSAALILCTDQSPWPRASWDPRAAANVEMPAGHGAGDALDPRPPRWRGPAGAPGPHWRPGDAFSRKGKLPATAKYAIVHLLLKLKKIFFLPLPKISLTAVQWSSHRGEGAGRSRPFSFRASSWVRGEDAHWWEGERGSIPGGCQEKHYRLFKTIRELYKSPLSLVKNKLESSEVIFFLYSKQVPVVYIYRVLEGWGSTLLRASLWLVRVRACVLVLSAGAFSLPHLKRDAHVTLLAGIPPLPLSCAPSVRSDTYPLRGLLSSFPAGECL